MAVEVRGGGALLQCLRLPRGLLLWRSSMLLGRGWKAFAHAHLLGPAFGHTHLLEDRHVLCFELAEADMLSVKFQGRPCVRLGHHEDRSSSIECSASSDGGGGRQW